VDGPRWELALELLASGAATVNIRGLVFQADPATATSTRRVHIEFECPFDPSQVGQAPSDRLRAVGAGQLNEARQTVAALCAADGRFAAFIDGSGVVYEFVHRYGMGALLVATAGQSGDLSWR